jgi:serine protease Do
MQALSVFLKGESFMQEQQSQAFPNANADTSPTPEQNPSQEKPVNPVSTEQNVCPAQPGNPVPPVQNVRPVQPGNPVPPLQNVRPVQPGNSVPPVQNVRPVQPGNPVPPVQNVRPVQPGNPVPPVQNVRPAQPGNPVPPVQNVRPSQPGNPVPPVNPVPPIHQVPPMNQVPPMHNPIPNWYQNQPPKMGSWQAPPQVPPVPQKPPMSPEKKDRRTAFWLKIVAGLLAALLLYCIGSDVVKYRHGETVPAAASSDTVNEDTQKVIIQQQDKPELDKNTENTDENGAYTVEGVAAAVRPSIVEIETYGDAKGELLSGTGSGIISSKDGYIITNAHVLTDGKSFKVIMSDESEYAAKVIGKDNKTDLAVIKIDGSDFPAATMGNSDEVVLGEAVVAIGNPAGLSGSVTNGIVSGLNRQIRSDATGFDMNCIQTNAAISPGNSGGALVNMYGQVIGITSSKYVSSSYEGLGFAITINEVLPIVQDLIDNGYVTDRVRVGITFISLLPEEVQQNFADEIGMKTIPDDLSGVWITEIAEDCDIANTELQVNDVIVSVQGEAVDDYDSLNAAIAGLKGGDTMEARCRRYQPNGTFEEFTIQCKLMEDTSGNY